METNWRSKCNWYNHRGKYCKFFLNPEKKSFHFVFEEIELTEQNEINNNIFTFYQNLFSKQTDLKQNDLINYLDEINLPTLSNSRKKYVMQ